MSAFGPPVAGRGSPHICPPVGRRCADEGSGDSVPAHPGAVESSRRTSSSTTPSCSRAGTSAAGRAGTGSPLRTGRSPLSPTTSTTTSPWDPRRESWPAPAARPERSSASWSAPSSWSRRSCGSSSVAAAVRRRRPEAHMTHCYEPIVVDAWRGPSVESRHHLVASVVDGAGREVARYGDPGFWTYWRSSAKPFQARPWVDGGTIEHFGWGDEELAIICASHMGTDLHAGLIRCMLADIGLSEADLRCDRELKARHNCSGNHTGMLAACVQRGWDLPSYQQPEHPAQQLGVRGGGRGQRRARGGDPARRGWLRDRGVRDAGERGGTGLRQAAAAGAAHRRRDAGTSGAHRRRGGARHGGHAELPRDGVQGGSRGPRLRLAPGWRRAGREGHRRRRPGRGAGACRAAGAPSRPTTTSRMALAPRRSRGCATMSAPRSASSPRPCRARERSRPELHREAAQGPARSPTSFEVIAPEMTKILKGGGGSHCMTFPLERDA